MKAGCPTRKEPSESCATTQLQNVTFPTSQCPKVKRCLSLATACSRTSSRPPAMLSTATPACEPLLIGSPVLKACCTSPNCNLCPWLLTACTTVMKSSLASVGECDSVSRRSGSVKPFMKSRALARARCCVLVRFPNTTPASVHRTIGPTCTTPWLLDSWAKFATPSSYSSGTRVSPQRSTSSF